MHEVHLVRAIIETVEREAAARGARRVKRVKLRFNALTSHSAKHVQFSFDVVKKDRPLVKDARLELDEVEPRLRCGTCGNEFLGRELPEICPKCGSVDVLAVHSTDLILEDFEIER